MMYDVVYLESRNGNVAAIDTFDSYDSAYYYAAMECEWEYYAPGESYVLAIQPHYTFVNLTPHEIRVIGAGPSGSDVIIPASGTVARCESKRTVMGYVNSIPINRTVMGEVYGLPEAVEGVIYLVSRPVAEAAADREDLLIPDESVRNEKGVIIGCKALAHI